MSKSNSSLVPKDLTILVVDDDSVTRLYLEKVLSQKYKVILSENGSQAWAILTSQSVQIDIVLTDMHMPVLDGMGLLNKVKSEFPHLCVIVLSGMSDIGLAVEAIKSGAHDYIPKPFSNLDDFEIIIWQWYRQQSLEAKLAQYVTLHREMIRNMKLRTFASLDVIKSREIKKYEDPFVVQFAFSAYHNFVAEIVEQHEGIIYGTAGDGVMTCFAQAANALSSAKQILKELQPFNQNRNPLNKDFKLRLGIHTGSVIVEKNGRINEMFSETLDITGHIQKAAAPNCITLSEATWENLQDADDFMLTDTTIAGIRIYENMTTLGKD